MPRRKIKLCLDENIRNPQFISDLSNKFKITTTKRLIPDNPSPDDENIFVKASAADHHILTRNISDFRILFRSSPQINIGILAIATSKYLKISPYLEELLDKKIGSHKKLYKKFFYLDLQGYSVYNKRWEEIISKTKWKNVISN